MKGFSGDTQSVSLLVSKQEKGVRQLRKSIKYEFYGSVDGGRWDSMIALDHLDLGPYHGYPWTGWNPRSTDQANNRLVL